MKFNPKVIILFVLSFLGVSSITMIKAAESSVGVNARFINPRDEVKLYSNLAREDLLLAEAPTSIAQQQQNKTTTITPNATVQADSNVKQSTNNTVPFYYVYSARYDIALGYNPERLLVENLAGEFGISTWSEYGKYRIVPIAGRNLEQAVSSVNLREYKFKNTEELVSAVIKWVKGRVYKRSTNFEEIKKDGDVYILPFSYKDLDYSALWQAYTRKVKKIDLNNYYVERKGAVYLFTKDNVLIAIYSFNVSDVQKELTQIKWFRNNLYIAPKFIKETEYKIYGTEISFVFNQRYWIIMPNKNSIHMEFYHSKYEAQPEYAALYNSTATLFIAPEKAYKQVTEEFLRERAIAMGVSDIKMSNPKLGEKEAKQKAESKVSKLSTKHLTFYCYTSPEYKKDWGGYKPSDSTRKPIEYRQICVAGKGKTVLVIRATIIKESEGEKLYNSMMHSFSIEEDRTATPTATATPTPVSWILDGQLHIVPVAKAASSTEILPLDTGSLLGPLGTLKLFNLNCVNFRVPVNKTTQAARLANKVYTLCGAGMGSGFAVDANHIVSNAHVMSPPPLMTLINVYYAAVKAINAGRILPRAIDHGLTKDMVTLATAAVTYYQKKGARFSNYSQAVKGVALQLLKDSVSTATKDNVKRASNTIWATVGKNGTFTIQGDSILLKNSAQMSKVQLLKDFDITPNLLVAVFGQQALAQGLSLKPDLALGKVNSTLKVVPLPINEESNYSPGTRITVIGYPGLIETSNILSVKSTYPTITKGTISGVKNAAGAKFKIVQISAAVAHGNSGGPVVAENGKVLGVLTYSFSAGSQDAADLAGAVDIQEARAILDSQHVTYNKSPLTAKVLEAISEYKKSHFKNAKKLLEEIKQQNPTYFGYVLDPILSRLQLYIDKGLDKSGFIFSPEMFGKYLLPIVGGLIFIGLGVALIKIIFKKKPVQPSNVTANKSAASNVPVNNALPQIGGVATKSRMVPDSQGVQSTNLVNNTSTINSSLASSSSAQGPTMNVSSAVAPENSVLNSNQLENQQTVYPQAASQTVVNSSAPSLQIASAQVQSSAGYAAGANNEPSMQGGISQANNIGSNSVESNNVQMGTLSAQNVAVGNSLGAGSTDTGNSQQTVGYVEASNTPVNQNVASTTSSNSVDATVGVVQQQVDMNATAINSMGQVNSNEMYSMGSTEGTAVHNNNTSTVSVQPGIQTNVPTAPSQPAV